jgi:hypothetical protein
MRTVIAVLAGLVLCLSGSAAPAGEPRADIGCWMSKEVQGLTVQQRQALFDRMVQAAGRQLDVQFLRDVFIQDPAREVKLKVLDAHVGRSADNWRALSRLDEWFSEDLLADYELTCAAADIVVAHTEKNRSMAAVLVQRLSARTAHEQVWGSCSMEPRGNLCPQRQ